MNLNYKGILYVFFVSLSTSILLIFIGFQADVLPEKGFSEIVFYSLQLTFITFGLLIAYSKFNSKIYKQKAIEYTESIVTGGIKEKLIFRTLEPYEREILQGKFKNTSDKNYDLDLRSPVFRTQGELIRQNPVGNDFISLNEQWSVRGIVMNEDNFPAINNTFFRNGEEIAIEFSPYSKWVWDTYKIFQGKRVWLMSLSDDVFKLLKSKNIKVVCRVPLGSHDLKDIKLDEYIEFTNSKESLLGGGTKILTKINFLHHYPKFEDLIESEKLNNVFPNFQSTGEAITFFNSLGNFARRIKTGGVFAIGVTVIDNSLN